MHTPGARICQHIRRYTEALVEIFYLWGGTGIDGDWYRDWYGDLYGDWYGDWYGGWHVVWYGDWYGDCYGGWYGD